MIYLTETSLDASIPFCDALRIAHDILSIPGVSVSIEQLFSSSRHTMSDSRSSMTADMALKAVVTKERLKKGLGEGVKYLQGINI